MTQDIYFFEAMNMQHALFVIKEKYGDNGVILFQHNLKSSKKLLVCAIKHPTNKNCLKLKTLSETIKKLIKFGFSKKFITHAYSVLKKNCMNISHDFTSYLNTIFEHTITSPIPIKGKSFVFLGEFGAGKTTFLIKFLKSCTDNTIFPNIYYGYIDKNCKNYDLNIILKKMHINMKIIPLNEVKNICNNNINFIDTQGINFNTNTHNLIKDFLSNSIIPIYIIRSDTNPKTLKKNIVSLKEAGVEYFIINHFNNDKSLGNTISILTEQNRTLLTVNRTGALQDPISMDVQNDIISIINS